MFIRHIIKDYLPKKWMFFIKSMLKNMKGRLRRIQDHIKNRTNFNDWSDPNCYCLYRREPNLQAKCAQLESPQLSNLPKESVISETSYEIAVIQRNVEAGCPLLTLDEVRAFRLPYYESLLLKLYDKGFIGTYQFIKDVIEQDDEWHKVTEQDYLVRKRPQLKLHEYALDLLSDGLCLAETANKEGNKADELGYILDLALSFTKLDNGSWYWLSEELYEQCIHITDSVESPTEFDRELAAILKYLFAEFLLDFLFETERAKLLVEESMRLSEGKFYNTKVLSGEMKDFLYTDSCILLHRILLVMAREKRESDIEFAIQLCKQSLHWAKVINSKAAEAKALLELVEIYIRIKQVYNIPNYLKTYLELCTELSDISGLCEGYILSAKYHNLTEEHDLEGEDLNTLLKTAEENSLLEIIALAHHRLAIFYLLHKNKQEDAQFHACEAFRCYLDLKKKSEIEASSCLVAICQSQGIWSRYTYLLSRANNVDNECFEDLMKWKTLRIPFFKNVNLLQIESEQNVFLQNKMENLRYEEINHKESIADDVVLLSNRTSHRTLMSHYSRFSQQLF